MLVVEMIPFFSFAPKAKQTANKFHKLVYLLIFSIVTGLALRILQFEQ